ncbi:CinA family protein [Palleronia sp. LCG004]|uniref:CinA family protein n=1 Tax=Palleronia sp. LCG004 TaxID=3079304 RepID=UPI0029439BE8|nr:CinA family protein [Palleronia sp. LCG004]WOI56798.1 CinA family protein [Palleronia sp. LCG004]
MNAADRILEHGRRKGATIATAESCTAGMIAAALTDPPGSSAVFDRGFVTYSNAAKTQMLGVSPATLETFGAVSEEVAREMADGARSRAGTTLAVAVTGIAGPGGSETKPEGRVCFAVSGPAETRSETREFGAIGRDGVRRATVDHALELILSHLAEC